jgi:hypothetical protein
MKKSARLHFIGACLVLLVSMLLFSGPAQAYVYDDFMNSGINSSLWVDVGPNTGFFSQPGGGYLNFNDSSGGQVDSLRSYDSVNGAFFVSMQYSDFLAINDTTAGAGMGSSAILRLVVDGNNYSYITAYKNNGGLGYRAFSVIGGNRTFLNYVALTNENSGLLGMYYNGIPGAGGEVEFWYYSGAGWMLLDSFAPNFSQAPFFSILGQDLYGSSLSFRVAQVDLTPIPLPAGALLMGSGLLGLVGWRRFRKA